jgi:tripartite-type tricarboxylate transporter receptor subunit TctC
MIPRQGWYALLTLAGVALAAPAAAQSSAPFYAGKTIELYVGSSAGAGYDLYARLLARHWSRHIPGQPAIVVRDMDGGGGLRLANWLGNVAARDGLVVGTITRGAAFDPLFGRAEAAFDAAGFGWIGSMNDEVSACVAWHSSDVKTFADLREKELLVGATGPSADTWQFPAILNGVLGTKMKMVNGYRGGNEIDLAMERGEVAGRCGWSWSSLKFTHPQWVAEKKINVLAQLALAKHPDLPDVPLVTDLARNEEEASLLRLIFARQAMAWPFLVPPGVPAARVTELRDAFDAAIADPAFAADAASGGYETRAVRGVDIQELVARIYRSPAAVVARAAALLKS